MESCLKLANGLHSVLLCDMEKGTNANKKLNFFNVPCVSAGCGTLISTLFVQGGEIKFLGSRVLVSFPYEVCS